MINKVRWKLEIWFIKRTIKCVFDIVRSISVFQFE